MKKTVLLLGLILLTGCLSSTQQSLNQAILLPEDRIFTVPAGQVIKVTLDGAPLEMTFPVDMKLVSVSTLVRQEEKLNTALFEKTKATTDRNKWVGIWGSVLTLLAGAFATYKTASTKKA